MAACSVTADGRAPLSYPPTPWLTTPSARSVRGPSKPRASTVASPDLPSVPPVPSVRPLRSLLPVPSRPVPPSLIPSSCTLSLVPCSCAVRSFAVWAYSGTDPDCAPTAILPLARAPPAVVLNTGGGLTVAVSHHFVSPTGLCNTLRLLREKPEQVSGVDRGLARDRHVAAQAMALAEETGTGAPAPAKAVEEDDHARRAAAGTALHDRPVAALQARRPGLLARAEAEICRRSATRPKSALVQLVAPAAASFSFGFGALASPESDDGHGSCGHTGAVKRAAASVAAAKGSDPPMSDQPAKKSKADG